jgi:hypothetical protein
MRVSILSTAANLLPVPGGLVVRTRALINQRIKASAAILANIYAGAMRIGLACLFTGLVGVGTMSKTAVIVLMVLGGGGAWASIAMFRSLSPAVRTRGSLRLVLLEGSMVVLSAARAGVAFLAIFFPISIAQMGAFTFPSILSSIVGIFPGGLGLREALSGAVGVSMHLPLVETLAAATLDRIVEQFVLAAMVVAVVVLNRRREVRRASLPSSE